MVRKKDEKSTGGGLNRRQLLGNAAAGGVTLFGLRSMLSAPRARADGAPQRPFIIYLHAGAYDGLAGSLLQPQVPNAWPRGLFYKNADGGSVNPNLNRHYKTGNLVLNDYNSFLSSIANNVCFATGT